MKLKHLMTVKEPVASHGKRVVASVFSPNNKRLAVVSTDNAISLYDDKGERREKFATKAANPKAPAPYAVTALAWSPDSTMLAVAQSDGIVFVYRLGLEWGGKKAIVHKFPVDAPVTAMVWPPSQPKQIVLGLGNGDVRLGQLRNNRSSVIFESGSSVVAMAVSPDGRGVASGHDDGAIFRVLFEDTGVVQHTMIARHSCIPTCVAWGEHIIAAGSNLRVTVYNPSMGTPMQTFDFSADTNESAAESICVSPSGQAVILGCRDRYRILAYSSRRQTWEESSTREIPHLSIITTLHWRQDGTRVVMGSLIGSIDLFDASMRRIIRGRFEFTYVSSSQIILRAVDTGVRLSLKSAFGYEILKVNTYEDRYVVAHTPETLIVADTETTKLSEVAWFGSGHEKFYFENPAVCMVFNAGELSLIEYGANDVLASCRTEHMSPHLVSVRLGGDAADDGGIESNRYIAYLIDLHTIAIMDLTTGSTDMQVAHDSRIDWLELNSRATKLLFRDKKRRLHLFDIQKDNRTTLLHYCSFVQWVPRSDVVVGQSRNNLCVWYAIDSPENVTNLTIKGDVTSIERSEGKTEVVVDEGLSTVSYELNDTLISFGAATEERDFERAAAVLESLEITSETEAMWAQLSAMTLAAGNLQVAERCYAARGDISKARYLHQVNKEALKNQGDNLGDIRVQAKVALLKKEFKEAENLYLQYGQVDEAMAMYRQLHKWDECLEVADSQGHANAEKLRSEYLDWLLNTHQEERAGSLKENSGDYPQAVIFYLKGGAPARAANVFSSHGLAAYNPDLGERIADALLKTSLFEKAGDFLLEMGENERALEAYKKGKAYRRAVDICRSIHPEQVVRLEEDWGDWLRAQQQTDAAINHYIEAGAYTKAIEVSFEARQWAKAIQIVERQPPEVAMQYYKPIAKHYETTRQFGVAEKYFVKAGAPEEAVDMYVRNGQWDAAHKVASAHMPFEEVAVLYVNQAQVLEQKGKLGEAERLYITVKEPDMAIEMYRKHRRFDEMIRVLKTAHPHQVGQMKLQLGRQLEAEGKFREAEKYYVSLVEDDLRGHEEEYGWQFAVSMYRGNDLWDDAMRVAKVHGGTEGSKEVAFAWASSLGGEAGGKLLAKFGLIEQAIDFACDRQEFDHAFELANALKNKLPEVHLKYAEVLEYEGRYKEAEDEFLAAKKPKEAVNMYIMIEDWLNATRVAEAYDVESVTTVLTAQAEVARKQRDWARAEALYVQAKKYESAVEMYQKMFKWNEAKRVAQEYMPSKLRDINAAHALYVSSGAAESSSGVAGGDIYAILDGAKVLVNGGKYDQAIDVYLRATKDNIDDLDYLEEQWECAARLAMQHVPNRSFDVVKQVSDRLLKIGRIVQAAELYEGIDAHKEAINVYVQAGMWDKARQLANTRATQYQKSVEARYIEHLKKEGQVDKIYAEGHANDALDIYAQSGEWTKCLDAAREEGIQTLHKYVLLYVHDLLKDTTQADSPKLLEAVSVLAKHGGPAETSAYPLYKTLFRKLMFRTADENPESGIQELREMMAKIVQAIKASPEEQEQLSIHETWLRIAHLSWMRNWYQANDMKEFSARCAISLLRYVDHLPADKMFYSAGVLCRDVGSLNMALVFLNRFLDISEAMEDPNAILENADFEETDVPYDFRLPEQPHVSEEKLEEIRDWVLATSMDAEVEQSLALHACSSCESEVYEASLTCPSCRKEEEFCVVTGYPVDLDQRTTCSVCGSAANRNAWNTLMQRSQHCPWCQAMQRPSY